MFLYWLNTEVLAIEANVRSTGLGSLSLIEAERQAVEWQALAFCKKLGYEECARIGEYASRFDVASMKKLLVRRGASHAYFGCRPYTVIDGRQPLGISMRSQTDYRTV